MEICRFKIRFTIRKSEGKSEGIGLFNISKGFRVNFYIYSTFYIKKKKLKKHQIFLPCGNNLLSNLLIQLETPNRASKPGLRLDWVMVTQITGLH